MKASDSELQNRFLYHKAGPKKTEVHKAVSQLLFETAKKLRDLMPHGRNSALALTSLEDARMRANAAVACDSCEEDYQDGGIELCCAADINKAAAS